MLIRFVSIFVLIVSLSSCCYNDNCGIDTYPAIYVEWDYGHSKDQTFTVDIYNGNWSNIGVLTTVGNNITLHEYGEESTLLGHNYVIRLGNQHFDTISEVSFNHIVTEEVCNPNCMVKKNVETRISFNDLQFKANGNLIMGNEVKFPL